MLTLAKDYINANASFGISIQYATLSEYFDAVLANDIDWPQRVGGDFGTMPCSADNSQYTYWTGYYTSRNFLKGHIRKAEANLRSADLAYISGSMQKYDLAQFDVILCTFKHRVKFLRNSNIAMGFCRIAASRRGFWYRKVASRWYATNINWCFVI